MFTPFLFGFFFIHGAIVILCYCRHIFTNRQSYLPILLSKLPAVIAATIVIIFCCHHRYWLPSSSLCSFVVAAAIIIVTVVIVIVAASIFITSNVIIICYYRCHGRHYSLRSKAVILVTAVVIKCATWSPPSIAIAFSSCFTLLGKRQRTFRCIILLLMSTAEKSASFMASRTVISLYCLIF